MYYHNLNPVILEIFGLQIRWYGLMYVIAFILGYFIIVHLAKKKKIDLDKEGVADLLFYIIVGMILGARIFYVFIYNLPYYASNPLEAFMFWNGGLSFHGGFLGAVTGAWLFARKKKIKLFVLGDLCMIPLALGLSFGRIGNFINGELVGRVTNVPWCFNFKGYEGCRHPSQLYESFKNLLLFTSLWFLKDIKIKGKNVPDGFLLFSFMVGYSILRFTVEFFRAPDEQLGFIFYWLSMGQILSIMMFVFGLVGFYWIFRKR